MTESPVTNMRIDPELKAKANEVFAELGLTMSAAVNIYLKAVVRERGIPFDMRIGTSREEDADIETE